MLSERSTIWAKPPLHFLNESLQGGDGIQNQKGRSNTQEKIWSWNKKRGHTRVRTRDRSDCSRMLYHWAIYPSIIMLCAEYYQFTFQPTSVCYTTNKEKGFKHPDFPAGHPRQYYPGLLVLNFSNQAGWGVFTRVWPNPIMGLGGKPLKSFIFLSLFLLHLCKRSWVLHGTGNFICLPVPLHSALGHFT